MLTEKEYEYQYKRISEILDRWLAPLGMGWWDYTVAYCGDPPLAGEGGMACSSDWRSREARIDVNMFLLKDQSDEEVELCCVQGLCHILVSELCQGEDDARVCETLAHALLHTPRRKAEPHAGGPPPYSNELQRHAGEADAPD